MTRELQHCGKRQIWRGISDDIGISYEGRTDLYVINGGKLTALRHQDKILEPIVRPFAGVICDSFNSDTG